ncbi:PREDICTED: uncharacterized protein LOC105363275 isoform X1 [Ceratosolen solmsi marchali]|uniref:Uncharacterized protein LOC105363275 isoform X1 n=1 Tax=Ceratosolen solmsi marchali TaxID=326594 RepID=A0AAJ6YJJ1_9HYME|nr:PREDICTED: uncharacterized protein LOC105363275 isoform X1 [Ceratosolen solmsi marchali]
MDNQVTQDPWQNQGWQDPWQQNKNAWNPWQQNSNAWNPWQQNNNAWNPWQSTQKSVIKSDWNPWQQPTQIHHHEPEVHHVIQVPQPHPIPAIHPKPLHLKVHSESVKLHYDHPKIPHPHLIGYEVYHEPKAEIKPAHGSSW